MDYTTQSATWQAAITIDGAYVAGCAIVPDAFIPGRGWFVGYAGKRLTNFFQMRPLYDEFMLVRKAGPFAELRAWIIHGAAREQGFARKFGFEYDCGPSTAFSPGGRDMDLFVWRRQ